jgi:hypothetical protein
MAGMECSVFGFFVGRLRPHFASKLISPEASGPSTNGEACPSSIADRAFSVYENWYYLLKAILLLNAKIEGEPIPLFLSAKVASSLILRLVMTGKCSLAFVHGSS